MCKLFCKHKNLECLTNLHGDYINLYSDDKTVRSIWVCSKCGKTFYKSHLNPDCDVVNFNLTKEILDSKSFKVVDIPDTQFKGPLFIWETIPHVEKEIAVNFMEAYMWSTAPDKEHILMEVVNFLRSGGDFDSSFISRKITYLTISSPGFPD